MDILEKNKSGCKTVTSYLMSYNSEIFDEKFKNVMMNDDEELILIIRRIVNAIWQVIIGLFILKCPPTFFSLFFSR
jgi:hypothetical protein